MFIIITFFLLIILSAPNNIKKTSEVSKINEQLKLQTVIINNYILIKTLMQNLNYLSYCLCIEKLPFFPHFQQYKSLLVFEDLINVLTFVFVYFFKCVVIFTFSFSRATALELVFHFYRISSILCCIGGCQFPLPLLSSFSLSVFPEIVLKLEISLLYLYLMKSRCNDFMIH